MNADFVILGAGSAGCALAYRLSETGEHSVIVIEQGGSDLSPVIQMPAALSYPMAMDRYDWGYWSEPEPHLGGRRLQCPRGKVLGGSSSINGMVYVRGHSEDYDGWERAGADGWGFRHVLPYFQRMECAHQGDEGWRGNSGPLHIQGGNLTNPLFDAFIRAGGEAGYPLTGDYNGQQQEGFGPLEMTVFEGRRWSAANAYLRPALKRQNLRLMSRTLVRRIILEGRKAVAVEVERDGQVQRIEARRAVVLAAGAINSPALLQRSGIGDPDQLTEAGIEIRHPRTGVGKNLQDHLELYVQMACRQPITLFANLGRLAKLRIGLQWLMFKSGLGASNHFEAGAFIRSRGGVAYPDIQFHFLPVAIRYDGTAPADGHGFQVHVGPMRSASRGQVRVQSNAVHDPPQIRFNYMSERQDWIDFRTCIRLSREIFAQPAFRPFAGREIAPGDDRRTDQDLDAFIRDHVESAYHPCGTCKMGNVDDPNAVVDPHCRVIGLENLHVADSSVFPTITNGNLNGPSIMVGEKAADHILGRQPLPASQLRPWLNPNWQTDQR
ncbi:MAG: choline dehydrogenase [Geminicoccaceae bacterium]